MPGRDRKGGKVLQLLVEGAVPGWLSGGQSSSGSGSATACGSRRELPGLPVPPVVVTTLPCFTGLARGLRPLDSLAEGCAASVIMRIIDWVWFCLEMG